MAGKVTLAASKYEQFAISLDVIVIKSSQGRLAISFCQRELTKWLFWFEVTLDGIHISQYSIQACQL